MKEASALLFPSAGSQRRSEEAVNATTGEENSPRAKLYRVMQIKVTALLSSSLAWPQNNSPNLAPNYMFNPVDYRVIGLKVQAKKGGQRATRNGNDSCYGAHFANRRIFCRRHFYACTSTCIHLLPGLQGAMFIGKEAGPWRFEDPHGKATDPHDVG